MVYQLREITEKWEDMKLKTSGKQKKWSTDERSSPKENLSQVHI
jgi:hypothetical protein